jgi:acyl dehydratase
MPRPADRKVANAGTERVASTPMDATLAGKAYPTTTFEVDAAHVERFASAVGQTVSGVPPTFLTAAEFGVFDPIVSDPELGLDFSRVLHGDQEYVWHRPVVVGETLEVRPRIAAIRERGGNGFLTIEVTLWGSGGEPVATTRATMIERADG